MFQINRLRDLIFFCAIINDFINAYVSPIRYLPRQGNIRNKENTHLQMAIETLSQDAFQITQSFLATSVMANRLCMFDSRFREEMQSANFWYTLFAIKTSPFHNSRSY